MKKRSVFTIAVLALTFVATAAFAYFTWTSTVSGNVVGTGEVKFQTYGEPMSVSGLMPGGPAAVSYVAIENIGDAPGRFKGWVSNFAGDTGIAQYVLVKVTLDPGTGPHSFPDNVTYGAGPQVLGTWRLTDLTDPAGTPLNNRNAMPMPIGFGAVYKIEVSLDAAAGNDCMNKSLTCDWNWLGAQVEDGSF